MLSLCISMNIATIYSQQPGIVLLSNLPPDIPSMMFFLKNMQNTKYVIQKKKIIQP